MEHGKTEIAFVEMVVEAVKEKQVCELNDLQLALVGGGSGDVVFA